MDSDNDGKASENGLFKGFLARKYDQMLDSIIQAAEEQMDPTKPQETVSCVASSVLDLSDDPNKTKLPEVAKTPLEQNDVNYMTNKELLHHVASSFLNTSIDRIRSEQLMNKSQQPPLPPNKEITFTSPLPIPTDKKVVIAPTYSKQKIDRDGFVDIFLERLLSKIITDKLPEREHFTEQLPSDTFKPSQQISPVVLASNLQRMTGQLNNIFEFQDSFIRLLTWRVPSRTMMTCLLITLILHYPLYLILLPLIFISYGLIISNYDKKYLFKTSSHQMKKSPYGKSLLERVTSSGKMPKIKLTKPLIDQLDDNGFENITEWEDSTSGLQVITNLRDLQDMTSNTLNLIDDISSFIHETAAFKDETTTTKLFIDCLLGYFSLKLISPWINWRLILSGLVWLVFICLHPKVQNKFHHSRGNNSEIKQTKLFDKGKKLREKNDGNRSKIIIDTAPLSNEIEIFEIYRKGLIPGEWKFFLLSSNVFDYSDEFRKGQQPPPGVKDLNQIYPPKRWFFDQNLTWEIDFDVRKWRDQRGLTSLKIDHEYLCDNMFKRRRLVRKVFR